MKGLFAITKSMDSEGYSTEEVLTVFRNTDDLDEIKSCVEKAKDRLYASWASVETVDKEGELIRISDVINSQETLMKRGAPITDTHTNRVIGRTLAYKVLTHPVTNTLGVLHLNMVFSDYSGDDEVWEETKNGTRTGSSVGGRKKGEEYAQNADGSYYKVLTGFEQYETASVVSPANPLALNHAVSAVAKSENINKIDKKKYASNEVGACEGYKMEKKQENEAVVKEEATQVNDFSKDYSELKKEVNEIKESLKSISDFLKQKKEEDEEMIVDEKKEVETSRDETSQIVESPDPVDANEEDAYKSEIAELKKSIEALKTYRSSETSRPQNYDVVKKARDEASNYAIHIAKSNKKASWNDVHEKSRALAVAKKNKGTIF